MEQKTILVTGAGGYIGRFVVKRLLDLGAKVIAVDRNTDTIDSRAKVVKLDIFSADKNLYDSLGRPDVCLHLAWKDAFNHNAPSHLELLPTHYRFLSNLVESGIPQIAVMGSMHEIGYHNGEINEETPANPRSLYGIAKNSLRQALSVLQQKYQFTFQWLRAFYVYGDDSSNHSILTKITFAEKEGRTDFPFTSGTNQYDFLSVEKLAEQISRSILQTEITGIINCCSGKPVALRDFIEDFLKRHNFKIRLAYNTYPERPYDSPAVWGNTDKISRILHGAV